MGLLVRALPLGVPVLPAAGRQAAATRSPSSASTPHDTDAAARTFLDELPLPYPSFTDPDQDITGRARARGFPATAFYDADGNLVYIKQGPYTSEADLDADIDKYRAERGRRASTAIITHACDD